MSDYISTLDFFHWTHYWASPYTTHVRGGLLPAWPPKAGFLYPGPPFWGNLGPVTQTNAVRSWQSRIRGPSRLNLPRPTR